MAQTIRQALNFYDSEDNHARIHKYQQKTVSELRRFVWLHCSVYQP